MRDNALLRTNSLTIARKLLMAEIRLIIIRPKAFVDKKHEIERQNEADGPEVGSLLSCCKIERKLCLPTPLLVLPPAYVSPVVLNFATFPSPSLTTHQHQRGKIDRNLTNPDNLLFILF